MKVFRFAALALLAPCAVMANTTEDIRAGGGAVIPSIGMSIDFMHASMVRAQRYAGVGPLKMKVSDYFKRNIWVTTSGMQWAPAIQFCISVLGIERVMYAMDYPYQFVPDEVKVTDELPIGESDRDRLYHLNAREVFKL